MRARQEHRNDPHGVPDVKVIVSTACYHFTSFHFYVYMCVCYMFLFWQSHFSWLSNKMFGFELSFYFAFFLKLKQRHPVNHCAQEEGHISTIHKMCVCLTAQWIPDTSRKWTHSPLTRFGLVQSLTPSIGQDLTYSLLRIKSEHKWFEGSERDVSEPG